MSPSGDRACTAVDKCDGTNQYVRVAATLTSNAICATEVQCEANQDAVGSGSTKVCQQKLISSSSGTRRLAAAVACTSNSDCAETNVCDTDAGKCQFFDF